jgi:hypothetical protein
MQVRARRLGNEGGWEGRGPAEHKCDLGWGPFMSYKNHIGLTL